MVQCAIHCPGETHLIVLFNRVSISSQWEVLDYTKAQYSDKLLTETKGEVRKVLAENRQLIPASLTTMLFPVFNSFSVASSPWLKVNVKVQTGGVDTKIIAN